MNVVKEGVVSPKASWWQGMLLACERCYCLFRLTPHDTPESEWTEHRPLVREHVIFNCPDCGHRVHVIASPVNALDAVP